MHFAPWSLCLWPGLPGLWQRGRARSLGIALAFSMLLNGTIWATVWRPAGTSNVLITLAWTQVLAFWLVSAWNSHRQLKQWSALPKSQQLDDWFRKAQSDYLKGHWLDAEAQLRRVLTCAPGDVQARLLLVSVFERAGRKVEAAEQLRELALQPGSEAWHVEREQLARRVNGIADGESADETTSAGR